MAQDTWEFYKDKKGEWRWKRTASNGEIVGASCEGYKNKSGCISNAQRNGYSTDLWEFYQDKRGEWRWKRTATNGKIVGASTEDYVNRADCVKNARRNTYSGN